MVALHLKADDGFRADMRGPAGPDGKDADPDVVAKRVMSNADFREKLRPPSVEDVTKRLMDDENFLLAIAGKDGEDGQSVTKEMVSEAVTKEMANYWESIKDEVIEMIPAPVKGDQGDKGLDADPKAVAAVLLNSKDFVDRARGPAGKDASPEDVADILMNTKDFVDQITGKTGLKGEDGKDATDEQVKAAVQTHLDDYWDGIRAEIGAMIPDHDSKEIADFLAKNAEFIASIKGLQGDKGDKGEPGRDADPVQVKDAMLQDPAAIAKIAGPQGEKGDKGEDGKDRPVVDVRAYEGGEAKRNEIVSWMGGLWIATRKAYKSPAEDSNAWQLITEGVADVGFKHDDAKRTVTISVMKSSGEVNELVLPDTPRFLPPTDGVKNITGDHFIDPEGFLQIFDGSDWQKGMSVIGPQGGRGRKGMKGDAGVGIKSIKTVGDLLSGIVMRVTYTDGTRKDIDLDMNADIIKDFIIDIAVPEQEEIDQEIKRFAGGWRYQDSYSKGDVVSSPQGLYLAMKDTSEELHNTDAWVRMLGVEGGMSGGGGAAGSAGINPPAIPSHFQVYTWQPSVSNALTGGTWMDGRTMMSVVDTPADLSDITKLPDNQLVQGKLVYVRSEGMLYEHLTDATTRTDTISDWKPLVSGVTYVGRSGDLPTSAVDGQLYVIRMDIAG